MMKSHTIRNSLLVLVTIAAFGAIIFASFSDSNESYTNLSVQEVKSRMDSGGDEFVLIDVRTPQEYTGRLGHLGNAPLYPIQNIDTRYKELKQYSEQGKELILYCRSGNRSRRAAEFLEKHGFDNVYNMEGGMRAWNNHFGRPAGSDNPPPNM